MTANVDWLPPISRAQPNEECITAFNELKLNKKYKYIIYKLSDDYKEIVVEDASTDKDWESFREKLINATSKTKSVRFHLAEQQWTSQDVMGMVLMTYQGAVGKGPRYAVYDFEYSLAAGDGVR